MDLTNDDSVASSTYQCHAHAFITDVRLSADHSMNEHVTFFATDRQMVTEHSDSSQKIKVVDLYSASK